MMAPKISRSRSSSTASSSSSSSPRVGSPSKSSGFPKPWPSCLPLPRSLSRKRDFSLQLTEPAALPSPSLPPASLPEVSSRHSFSGPVRNSFRNLSPALLREIQQAFELFDANRDGKISAEELAAVLRSLGDDVTEVEALQMVKEVDSDGDGFINLQEFIDLNTRSPLPTGDIDSVDELTATFDMFDLDRNGRITAEELHSVLLRLGDRNCTVEDCKRMIRGVDRKGAGHVDFDDFKLMMMAGA